MSDSSPGVASGSEVRGSEVKDSEGGPLGWVTPLGQDLRERVGSREGALLELSHAIHANPEVRFEEQSASRLLMEHLGGAGFEVTAGSGNPALGSLDTAFRAERSFGTGGPTIAIFCEYDALPGIGHACGHNIIGTAGAGAAIAAAGWMEENGGNGRIVVLGSPGEEGGGGKVYLADAGALNDVDAAIMVHPSGYDAVRRYNLGRSSWRATFHGKASHASSAPDRGVNALDAATLLLVAIGLLRQQLRSDTRIHANIVEGGDAINVIPERTQVRFYLRSTDPEYLRGHLQESVRNCVLGAALATGTEAVFEEAAPSYDPVNTNPVLAELSAAAFTSIGRPLDVTTNTQGGAGSTDMGNVSQIVPSLHPYIGIRAGVPGHTREFAEAAGSPDGDRAVVDGAAMLATMAVGLLTRPEVLDAAKRAFAESKEAAK